jgi:hypothetical protein
MRALKTAPTRIESRLTGPLVGDWGRNSCPPPSVSTSSGRPRVQQRRLHQSDCTMGYEFSPRESFLSAAPKGWGCGGIFPIRLGQPRRRSSLGRDELLVGGATQKYPVILDGLPIQF